MPYKKKGVFITTLHGLGDHIVCLGIYRELAKRYKFCIVPTSKTYSASLDSLLGSASNIFISSFMDSHSNGLMLRQRQIIKTFGLDVVDLGFFGRNFLKSQTLNFDEQMYIQAGVDFEMRWKAFDPIRNDDKERKIFESYNVNPGEYIFLHEDSTRNLVVNRDLIHSKLRIVKPAPEYSKHSITDYMLLIENAAEIHTIESSFGALIESMNVAVPKYAHRYARRKVVDNPRTAFTYKTAWEVLE
jgi:hypothetical protein